MTARKVISELSAAFFDNRAAIADLVAACRAALRDEMNARGEAAGGLSEETVAMLEAAIAKAEVK
jgi:hypothetical protein